MDLARRIQVAMVGVQGAVEKCKGRCYLRGTGRYMCGSCKRTSRKLCRKYHEANCAEEELIGRLMYESFVGIISFESLRSGKWLVESGRDNGHTERIRRLLVQIRK